MIDANRNQLWARCLIEELVRSGVTDICIAPGSRSTPLVLAAARASEVGELKLRVFIDERSAGFFALGLGRATGRPAVVITTSGTAVANLLPAAVEADRSEVPLLLLTADRPRHLRDADANQSIDQVGIFGSRTRAAWDLPHPVVEATALRHLRGVACRAVAEAIGAPAGPVHLNVPFAKPLEPTVVEEDQAQRVRIRDGADGPVLLGRPGSAPWVATSIRRTAPDAEVVTHLAEWLAGAERPLMIAGHLPLILGGGQGAGEAIVRAAAVHGAPLLADPLSGVRFGASNGATRVAAYDTILRDRAMRDGLRPDLIVRFGRSATSTVLQSWLEELRGIRQVVIDDGALWKDHGALTHRYLHADPGLVAEGLLGRQPVPADRRWRALWEEADAAVAGAMAAPESAELRVARAVLDAVDGGTPVFASSSMPIRDLDTVAVQREEPIPLFGNRGASGIDGIVSSALGVAAAAELPSVCLLGDLAMLHDSNGLAAHREASVVFVLVNNDGGGIFHMLPVAEQDPPFTQLFATPHGRDFAKLAGLYDLPHRIVRVEEIGGALKQALRDAHGGGGSRILEVRTDRTTEPASRSHDRERALVAARAMLELQTHE